MDREQQTICWIDESVKARPFLIEKQIRKLALQSFGLDVNISSKIQEVGCFEDKLFVIQGTLKTRNNASFDEKYYKSTKFCLKIYNSHITQQKASYEELCHRVNYCNDLCSKYFELPHFVPTLDGDFMAICQLPIQDDAVFQRCSIAELLKNSLLVTDPETGKCVMTHLARLSIYIEGDTVQESEQEFNESLCFQLGVCTAHLNKALETWSSNSDVTSGGTELWSVIACGDILKQTYLPALKNTHLRETSIEIINHFQSEVLPHLENNVQKCWIHGDVGPHNVLLSPQDGRLAAIFDFDDFSYSYSVVDLAIAMTFLAIKSPEPSKFMNQLKNIYNGYTSVRILNEFESRALYYLCLMRFVQGGAIISYKDVVDPGDNCVFTYGEFWSLLLKFVEIGEETFWKELSM